MLLRRCRVGPESAFRFSPLRGHVARASSTEGMFVLLWWAPPLTLLPLTTARIVSAQPLWILQTVSPTTRCTGAAPCSCQSINVDKRAGWSEAPLVSRRPVSLLRSFALTSAVCRCFFFVFSSLFFFFFFSLLIICCITLPLFAFPLSGQTRWQIPTTSTISKTASTRGR